VGALNGAHIFGTLVPVEEPSTASDADSCTAPISRKNRTITTRIHATHVPMAELSTASEADLKYRTVRQSHYWSWLHTFRHRSSLALSGSGPTTTPLLIKSQFIDGRVMTRPLRPVAAVRIAGLGE
jgi:hypothetical protein